jgi:hypothetical protein
MQGVRRFFVGISAAAFVLSGITTVVTTTSASASASSSISVNPKLVGTYNVKVKLNPAFGGTKLSSQITLASAASGNVCALDQLTQPFVVSVAVAPDDVAPDHRVLLLV